ncbi:MAG: CHRD domain-containing protein [Sphaerobacter sp.]|nr:CHRD domain-containing protein [Sphaerobacter sp.]
MKRIWVALALGALLALFAVAPASAADEVTVTLSAQNDSGEMGTATLTAMGDQTRVVLNLTGAPAGPQPAHIHEGTCANLNPQPRYPLTNVENGQSETMVPVSLTALMNGNFAINVHKSPQEAAVYVSCGNIPAVAQVAPGTGHPRTGAAGWLAGGAAVIGALAIGGGALLRRRAA